MKKFIAYSVLSTLLVSGAFAANMANPTPQNELSDGQVTKILTTANDGEILLARHVIANTKNEKVKTFAQHMIDDHTLNNSKSKQLAADENIQAEESPKSEELLKKEKETQDKLMSLKGRDLDIAYMDDQIKTHQKVLNDLNTNLLAEAQDPALKAHLLKTAEKVQLHLKEAKEIRASL